MLDILVQCHFLLQPSLSPEIPLLHSHLDAFGIFTLGPSLFSDVAAHVGKQLLHFTRSRSCWPEGENISYLCTLYSQNITAVSPLGYSRKRCWINRSSHGIVVPFSKPGSTGKSAEI